jgi:uncharacterized protein
MRCTVPSIMDTKTAQSTDILTKVLLAIAIIGALNWGLIGFFNFNLVEAIFGGASRVIYAIVGICALVAAFLLPGMHRAATERRAFAHSAA